MRWRSIRSRPRLQDARPCLWSRVLGRLPRSLSALLKCSPPRYSYVREHMRRVAAADHADRHLPSESPVPPVPAASVSSTLIAAAERVRRHRAAAP